MANINYIRPPGLEEALEVLAREAGGVCIYAGGTDIMVRLREQGGQWSGFSHLLDLGALSELKEIALAEGLIHIGAMVTHDALSRSPLVKEYAPCLAQAAAWVGSPQIRNSGTIGGNIANGSLAADTLPPLIALEAEARIISKRGSRLAPICSLYEKGGPALAADELIAGFQFPARVGWGSAFIKLGRRKALAISRLSAAAMLRLEAGKIAAISLAPGCVFSQPDRAGSAEALLLGQEPGEELFAAAGREVAEDMVRRTGVRWSTEYKKPAIAAIVARTLNEAWRSGELCGN